MLARITSVDEERAFEAYVQALFKRGDNTCVRDALAGLEVPAPYRLRVKVLYAPSSPVSVMEKLLDRETLQTLSNESRAYVFNTTVGRKNLRTFQVPFVIAPFEDDKLSCHVQAIIAICKSDHWKALGRFIRNNYPDIVPILLSQLELIRGAQRLKQYTGHDVRVRAFSAKESVRGAPGKYRKSERVWTDEELDEALRSIQERRQIITSLDVDFFPRIGGYTHVRPKTACKIRKDGEIEVTGGFLLAFNAVAKQVAQVGERKLQFFSGRGLRESNYKSRPLAINFALPILEDLEVLRNLVQVLAKYPYSMHAVEHGNPYAHVKVTDLYDWSSFDVWAIPPRRVALIPGLKATEAAFERLIHYIFEAFREGRVTTYDHEERALEEDA